MQRIALVFSGCAETSGSSTLGITLIDSTSCLTFWHNGGVLFPLDVVEASTLAMRLRAVMAGNPSPESIHHIHCLDCCFGLVRELALELSGYTCSS